MALLPSPPVDLSGATNPDSEALVANEQYLKLTSGGGPPPPPPSNGYGYPT